MYSRCWLIRPQSARHVDATFVPKFVMRDVEVDAADIEPIASEDGVVAMDGSCMHGNEPWAAYAGAAVVQMDKHGRILRSSSRVCLSGGGHLRLLLNIWQHISVLSFLLEIFPWRSIANQ